MAAIAKGEQRRALVIAGGGFLLVLALFVGSRLLAGNGDDVSSPVTPPTTAPETTPGTPPRGPGPLDDPALPVVPIPKLPDAFEYAELRDPFTPPLAVIEFLRSLRPAPTPGVPDPGAPPAPGAPSPRPGLGPEDVLLRSIQRDAQGVVFAILDVEGSLFEASEGERFGPGGEFMVVSLDIDTGCGVFLFGDERFVACEGQRGTPAPPGAAPTPQK